MSLLHTRWAAVGAAVAVTLAGGGVGLVGATSPTNATTFVPITPCRVMDTRPAPDNVGTKNTPLTDGEIHTVTARGDNGDCTGIPTSATAVSLNVTAVGASLPTFLTIWAAGAPQPKASSLNPAPGAPPTPNAVTTELSGGGQFSIFNKQGSIDVIADINGYYVDHDHDDRYYTESEVDALIAAIPAGADGTDGTDGADGTDLYTRTIVVNGDGTDSANGAALLAAVSTAASMSPTAADPWIIELEPGTYDVGTTQIFPTDYVSLRGAGQRSTRVTGSNQNLLRIESGVTVSDLAIDTTYSGSNGETVRIDGATGATLRNLDISEAGTASQLEAIRVGNSTQVLITGVNATGRSFGVNLVGMEGNISDSTFTGITNPALNLLAGSFASDVTVTNTTIESLGGGDEAIRVTTDSGHQLTIRHSSLLTSGGESVVGAGATNFLNMFNTHLATTQAISFGGTAVCAGITRANGTFSTATCI